MEDVERSLTRSDRDLEAIAGLAVGDGDEDLVVALAPEQPDVDAVVGALVEFVKAVTHGSPRSAISKRLAAFPG
jgi:hypothetical protein